MTMPVTFTGREAAEASVILDPTRPIMRLGQGKGGRPVGHAYNQRLRRSTILATIRTLLAEEGLEGVTVRRIAEQSGHAVQTIYNLVGPRDLAIVEAISEYSLYVSLSGAPDPADPLAPAAIVDRDLASILINPGFCRNVCLIYFSNSRSIFYAFRDRQVQGLHRFLQQQQRSGVLRDDVDARALAERIMFFLGALCVEWADRDFPFEDLRRRLYDGYESLMAGALAEPNFRIDRSAPIVPDPHWC